MPEWDYRYFSFNCNWDDNGKAMMASMRDGLGSEYFLHFSENGVVGKVFSQEETINNSVFLEKIPDCFADFKSEVAFNLDNGASVRGINPRNNMGAGACIGNACRGLSNGDKVKIEVVD